MEIFITNLNTGIEEELLSKLFEVFGEVSKAVIAKDHSTGASKGFGFVTMINDSEALKAIDDLNGRELAGKTLVVKESVPNTTKVEQKRTQNSVSDHAENDSFNNSSVREASNNRGKERSEEKVIDPVKFTKSDLENGLIQVKFKK